MNNKIIMLCGRIGSGKTTFAMTLQKNYNMVVLSCDNYVLAVNDNLQYRHKVQEAIAEELINLARNIWKCGLNVVLDFGFWYKDQRSEIKTQLENEGISVKLYYFESDNRLTDKRIIARNKRIIQNNEKGYIIDLKMKSSLDNKFEVPDTEEIDYIVNQSGEYSIAKIQNKQILDEILSINDFIIEQKCFCDNIKLYIRPLYIEKINMFPAILDKISDAICDTFIKKGIRFIFALESAVLPCASLIANKLSLPLCVIRKQNSLKHEELEPDIFIPDDYCDKYAIIIDDALWTGKSINYCYSLFEKLNKKPPCYSYFIFDFRNFIKGEECIDKKFKSYYNNSQHFIDYKTIIKKAYQMNIISSEAYMETIKLFRKRDENG